MKDNVIIMGAGIQGMCCALALSNLNIPVTLIDKAPEPLSRASLRNEGKIHLGFIYANDTSFRSASLMLRSAVCFASTIESLLGYKVDWKPLRSRKFNYLILEETMLSSQAILSHYHQLQKEYDNIKDPSNHYLGNNLIELFTETNLLIPELNQDAVRMCIPTEELAVNLVGLREILIAEMKARNNISFYGNYCVEEIKKTSYGYHLKGSNCHEGGWNFESSQVINCLWESRLLFDQQLGFDPQRKWVYRLKHRILGIPSKSIAALDSFTCVLGAFGDMVNYDNHYTYLSWYPECMRGWSTEITTPASWEDACNGRTERDEWVEKALAGLDHIFPGLAAFDIKHLDGGIIFSWGKTDIDDLNSELHNRFEIGIHHDDGYYSIDTGKFTSAPFFAGKLQKHFL